MAHDRKARQLRRYECDAHVFDTVAGAPAIDLFSPFGPLIAKTSLPPALLERINAYADTLVDPARSTEFALPESLVFEGEDSLALQTARVIGRFVERLEGEPVEQVKFQAFWIVSQYERTHSPVHFHSGDISGVLYLKVPTIADAAGQEAKTYISGRQAGFINFIGGGRQPFSRSLISFKPQVGDFYLFPGWLLHGAEPFQGGGERRSMSFNAFLPGRQN